VIVDYLQLLTSDDTRATEYSRLTEISRTLKTIALRRECCVMALSQLSREGRKQSRKDGKAGGVGEPTKADLRGSGSIEQDADQIALLWCTDAEPDEEGPLPETRKVSLKLAKNRRGPRGEVDLTFHGPTRTFAAFERAPIPHSQRLRTEPQDDEDLIERAPA
jgi:replicative DNA helicase